ncbi:MAG TPA: hypothetical protein VGO27_22015, partial [Candidatus Acidoferrum sp.]|nr:hypothetical protein [Candidatus Acidoferrum sp.]
MNQLFQVKRYLALFAAAMVALLLLRSLSAPESSASEIPAKFPTMRPVSLLDTELIPRTPERLARGKYLVEGLLQCPACHSENDFSKRPVEVLPGKKLGGSVFPN